MADILIMGEQIEIPKAGESYIDIRIYETGEIVIDGDQDKSAKAIELPKHDRLIDAKEFACQVYAGVCGAKDYCDYKCDSCHAKIIVDEFLPVAPTIVEASNG